MVLAQSQLVTQKISIKKVTIGLVVATALALTSVSAASAESLPTNKEQCRNGGYVQYGFQNQGQCIASVVHANHNGGYGGNNGNNVEVKPNIIVNLRNAAHNVVNVVVNVLFGNNS